MPKEYPRKIWPLRVIPYALSVATISFEIEMMTSFLWYVHTHHLIVMGIAIYTIYRAYQNHRIGTRWIVIGSVAMIIFSLADMLKAFTGRSGTFVIHFGFAFFVASQAAAIAQVYTNIFRRLVREQEKTKHSFTQLGKVFYPHQLDLMEQGEHLESTMPTGNSQGCAICFDIVSSTKIKHVDRIRSIKNYFSSCYGIMMENYDPKRLSANAYRVKEMGDGFLCSIGYPFKIPEHGKNPAEFAVELSYRFAELFEVHRRKMDYARPIHFAMGIAVGDLHGFYPETGTKEYDLQGRALVLATRYERMRKQLKLSDKECSVIILQEDIFLSLPSKLREKFQRIDLKKQGLTVRDDPHADVVYVHILAEDQTSTLETAHNTGQVA